MDHHDHELLPSFHLNHAHPSWIIAVAEGVLIERYRITAKLARTLLEAHAHAAGVPVLETAHRLIRNDVLP